MSQLAVAIDLATRDEVLKCADHFRDLPVTLKFGLKNLSLLHPEDFGALKSRGVKIFADTKLLDIPSQCAGAVRMWSGRAVDYLTVHLSGGNTMLKECAAAAGGLRLLGVSVLTSLSSEDLADIGVTSGSLEQVKRLTKLGMRSGISSYVCSLGEVTAVRESLTSGTPFFVCPGLVLEGEAPNVDQKRSFTVEAAIRAGVDLLVVGRSIVGAKDPRGTAESILEKIARA